MLPAKIRLPSFEFSEPQFFISDETKTDLPFDLCKASRFTALIRIPRTVCLCSALFILSGENSRTTTTIFARPYGGRSVARSKRSAGAVQPMVNTEQFT